MTDNGSKGEGTRVRYIEIAGEEAGQRIDNFLTRVLKGLPRSRVYRILRRGEVRVNRSRVRPDYRLKPGDSVRIPPVRLGERPAAAAPSEAFVDELRGRILLEDQRLLILDKPAGLAAHGGSGVSLGLIEALRAARPEAPYLELAHRLDRATSGCIMIAKRRSALRSLHELLRAGEVEKRYLALVAGDWQRGEEVVCAPLAKERGPGGERFVRVDPSGKKAESVFRPVEGYGRATLMEVTLITGRTHQIRVHAAHAGHPLAGDSKYGDRAFDEAMRARGLGRLFLHAHSVSFAWPQTGEPIHVSAPLPDALKAVLDDLEQAARGGGHRRRPRPRVK